MLSISIEFFKGLSFWILVITRPVVWLGKFLFLISSLVNSLTNTFKFGTSSSVGDNFLVTLKSSEAVSYTHLTLPTTPVV